MSAKQHLQPKGLFDASVYGYTQVVTSPPGTQVFIAGQVGWNESGGVVSLDVAEQAKKALENLDIALTAAGATRKDITLIRLYIPKYDASMIPRIAPHLARFFDGMKPPAQTLIGVEALALPDLLIEIEALAVITG